MQARKGKPLWRWDTLNGMTHENGRPVNVPQEGMKFDNDKLDYTLLPWPALEEVVKVLQEGEKKYARDNWKKVEHAQFRYLKAAFRHLVAYTTGEKLDRETGLSHLAHCVCCCLFVISFDKDMDK